MKPLLIILAVLLPVAIILLLSAFLLFLWHRRRRELIPKATPQFTEEGIKSRRVAKLHIPYTSTTNSRASLRFHHLHHHHHRDGEHNQKPPFNWQDHPRLIAEATESGWSRFAFKIESSTPPSQGVALCAVCDGALRRDMTGTSWEVPHGSSEFIQTVCLNPGAKRSNENFNTCSFRMSLPLPGPDLAGSPFPQEAYFEIAILHLQSQQDPSPSLPSKNATEDDSTKLIRDHSINASERFDTITATQEPKENGKRKPLVMSLGLSVSNSSQNSSLSGTYPGSIGFHSNGSVYLDGMKLVIETERSEWAGVNRVIGCGFDPRKKKVYFTVDSQLMHAINCNSEAYRSPLYPVVTSNFDAMVSVNLGQSRFKYGPANARRTSNPCLFKSSGSGESGSSVAGFDDSGELFSVDSGWLEAQQKNKTKMGNGNSNDGGAAMDIDADSDLFEISLKD
ncbi:uncharacterized protein [Typha latifolia]|uniref:uncharacterized protein n=1 Tax=Typha latifolia TaxID=4733 RepID=UPI003C2F077B